MTRRGGFPLLPAILAVAAAAACSQPSPTLPAAPAPTVAAAAPAAPTVAADVPGAEVPTPAAAAKSWVMPNLVGTNLQAAQDRIQSLTGDAIFLTTSHDETGAGRQQILDRNWKVCSQSVRPGQKITADSQIDFGAVKTTESC